IDLRTGSQASPARLFVPRRERVYITARACELELCGTKGLQAAGAGGLLRTSFLLAEELYEATNPGSAAELGMGPTFDELLDVTREYIQTRVTSPLNGDKRDIGIYKWRSEARDVLENAIRGAAGSGTAAVPILANPEW